MPVETRGPGGGKDADAIHDNVDGEINAIGDKALPVGADIIIIEDSAATYSKKKVSISNLPGGGDPDAIHDNVASEITGIVNKAIPVAADELLIEDSADTYNKKAVLFSALEGAIDHDSLSGVTANEHLDWTGSVGTIHTGNYIEGGDGTDTTAIHDDTVGEINALSDKPSPVGADILIIEDSEASYGKKKVTITNLPGGADADAIHDNVAQEIQPITGKASPVGADVILIEDSAATWNKKSVLISNLPAGSPSFGAPTGGIDIGDAAVEGSSGDSTRADHQHLFTAPAASYPLDVAATESDGVATTPARSDHVHAHGSGYSASAHHTKYLDTDTEGVITAELVDGQSIDVAIDALITTHTAIATAHIDNFTDITTRNHTDINNKNAEVDFKHLTDAQQTALHAIYTLENHGSAAHTGAVLPAGANEDLGAFYLDIDDIAVPTDPAATIRRLFVDTATGKLSVRTNASTTISLEEQGGTDADAIHDNVANEITGIGNKVTIVAADELVIEDSAAAYVKKAVLFSVLEAGIDHVNIGSIGSNTHAQIDTHIGLTNEHLDWTTSVGTIHTGNYIEGGAGTDTDALHDNVANEITAITPKVTPVSADEFVMEDSAAAFVKKAITYGNLESAIQNHAPASHALDVHSVPTGSIAMSSQKFTGMAAGTIAGDSVRYEQLHTEQHAMDSTTYHTRTDITTLDASISFHGFLRKLDNVSTNFLNGQGNWAVPAGTGLVNVVEDTTPQLGGPLDLNSKPFTEELVAAVALSDGDLCYMDGSGEMALADADAEATCDTLIAMCTETISASSTGTFILLGRYVTTGLTAGAEYWVSLTAGAITTTRPSATGDIVRHVGTAISTTVLFFNPSHTYLENT